MWQWIFWISVGLIFYAYFGYPLVLFLVTRVKKRPDPPEAGQFLPTVCLLISAYNEEKVIRKKIENSLEIDYPGDKVRIVVASDGSTDRTGAIVEDYSDMGVVLYNFPRRRGKSAVLNDIVPRLEEEIVVFTDANSLFAPDTIKKLVRHFGDPGIGCVVGRLKYVDRHTSSVGKGEGIYWRYESRISRMESALESVLVANGSIFAIRRELYKEISPDVANDFQLPVEISNQGYGVVYEPEAEAVERTTLFWNEEFSRKVRIVLRGITGFSLHAGKFKGFRLWQFLSHKLMRWMVGFLLVTALLSNVVLASGSNLYRALLILQLLFYAAALNGWRLRNARKTRKIFYVPFYFTLVNLAALVAMMRFLFGHRQVVWDKAESARFAPMHTNNGSGAPAVPSAANEAVPDGAGSEIGIGKR